MVSITQFVRELIGHQIGGIGKENRESMIKSMVSKLSDLRLKELAMETEAYAQWAAVTTEFNKYFKGKTATPPFNDENLLRYLSTIPPGKIKVNELMSYILGIRMISTSFLSGGADPVLLSRFGDSNLANYIFEKSLIAGEEDKMNDKTYSRNMYGNCFIPIIYGRVYPDELKEYLDAKPGTDITDASDDIIMANLYVPESGERNRNANWFPILSSRSDGDGKSEVYDPKDRVPVSEIINPDPKERDKMEQERTQVRKAYEQFDLPFDGKGKIRYSPDMEKHISADGIFSNKSFSAEFGFTKKAKPKNVKKEETTTAPPTAPPAAGKPKTDDSTARNFIEMLRSRGVTEDKIAEGLKSFGVEMPVEQPADPRVEQFKALGYNDDQIAAMLNALGPATAPPAAAKPPADTSTKPPAVETTVAPPAAPSGALTNDDMWKLATVVGLTPMGNGKKSNVGRHYQFPEIVGMIENMSDDDKRAILSTYTSNMTPLANLVNTKKRVGDDFSKLKSKQKALSYTTAGRAIYMPDNPKFDEKNEVVYTSAGKPDIRLIDEATYPLPPFLSAKGDFPDMTGYVDSAGKPYMKPAPGSVKPASGGATGGKKKGGSGNRKNGADKAGSKKKDGGVKAEKPKAEKKTTQTKIDG